MIVAWLRRNLGGAEIVGDAFMRKRSQANMVALLLNMSEKTIRREVNGNGTVQGNVANEREEHRLQVAVESVVKSIEKFLEEIQFIVVDSLNELDLQKMHPGIHVVFEGRFGALARHRDGDGARLKSRVAGGGGEAPNDFVSTSLRNQMSRKITVLKSSVGRRESLAKRFVVELPSSTAMTRKIIEPTSGMTFESHRVKRRYVDAKTLAMADDASEKIAEIRLGGIFCELWETSSKGLGGVAIGAKARFFNGFEIVFFDH